MEVRLKDGRALRIACLQPGDAAENVAYVDRVSGETDYFVFGPGESGVSVEEQERIIRQLEGNPYHFMLKGSVDGQIVSNCIIVCPKRARTRHRGELGISVLQSHWRLGVGKAMCLAMLDVARRGGVTKVNLQVRESNVGAIGLYESLGFLREGVTGRATRISERYYANVMMGVCLD